MYKKITGIDAYKTPMMISPAAHFSMGGLWVDYELMSNLPGLFVLGEANFADHGANRLGANSLLQACVDGYFIIPSCMMNYLANEKEKVSEIALDTDGQMEALKREIGRLLQIKGSKTPEEFHKQLGRILYNKCGLVREKSELIQALQELTALQEEFDKELLVAGKADDLNFEIEKALRVSDYLELAQLIVHDALQREESCGAHFRKEHQTNEGEALRNDKDFQYVSAWEYVDKNKFQLHKEELNFEFVKTAERSYK